VPLAVLQEQSDLYRPGTSLHSSLRQGIRAVNRSAMWAHHWSAKAGNITLRTYHHETRGVVDLTHRRKATDVFGYVHAWGPSLPQVQSSCAGKLFLGRQGS
jgi:hypothetical protein